MRILRASGSGNVSLEDSANSLVQEIAKLKQAGYIVLDYTTLTAFPEELDITDIVLESKQQQNNREK